MDTKELIINTSLTLFHQKGYLGVGLNEILKVCSISKGSLYHHFPNGKEELLIACLHSLNETITTDMEEIFSNHPSTQTATQAMIEKLAMQFDRDGTITGYTFSSIVSEMGSLSEPVRNACALTFTKIQGIYASKLESDGFSKETAESMALMLTASIEGGIMLCLTKKTSDPLTIISKSLPNLLKVF
ncbi:TetR/AcrR family transcriptional regulator [Peribacillus psychrosaccharolyticus]|uniref:TetR/AcrR family transcriptional regulator n=1 Tax=Peribacillus psychrosaccharolyticus TaxID=1407 RepID=A0A974NNA3_PERPY|nr:TetR/AcrR family transcriptional regulator [Peribacillus psychrosaccharolyticus]MEC2056013.1 TetR/AcrR family transcriptional regulator [Peribacillus psychrosaccharolyticus]MED3745455.1 TetR/AcrR family transcriptional regulator [Peribacillus psychrosaccharolyticus]QQT00780.1 TetR/AcrR family transcriptional regulator [Peribacillus psychrosaccharolyticus]